MLVAKEKVLLSNRCYAIKIYNGTISKNVRSVILDIYAQFGAISTDFYARKQLLLLARFSHRNSVRLSVCLSVRLSVTRVDQSKTVQGRITKSSPSAAWKTLVSGTVKLFDRFKGGHPE